MPLTIGSNPTGPGFCLETDLELGHPRPRVFDFFADAFQLEAITPPWLKFQVTTPAPIRIQAGTLIDYKLRIHGLPVRWRSRISVWEPPFRFVDEQIRGPYRRWHHEHSFEETSRGTLVRDIVHYEVHGGRTIDRWFVRPDLQKIFSYRTDQLRAIFGADSAAPGE